MADLEEPEEEPEQPQLRFWYRRHMAPLTSALLVGEIRAFANTCRWYAALTEQTLAYHAMRRLALQEVTYGGSTLRIKHIVQQYANNGAYSDVFFFGGIEQR